MNSNSHNTVLLWSTAISSLLDGKKAVGGIAVQLYFWAQAFACHGWNVYTLTMDKPFVKDNVIFKKWHNWGKVEIIHEWIGLFWKLLLLRPTLVISRGADRVAYPLAVLSKMFGVKYVCFSASDVNFEPDKELIAGGKHNRLLWQKAVSKIEFFVVQNQNQQSTLKTNYHKDSLVLFNIWGDVEFLESTFPYTDVVWVANLRKLKRPEWVLTAAEALPNIDFTMVGGPTADKAYYSEIQEQASKITNLHFLGPKSFWETNVIVSHAKVLSCSSTFEGFPNTFLQAWSAGIPVVSTVNPSCVITDNDLGEVVESFEEFVRAIQRLVSDEQGYFNKCTHVIQYFKQNHSVDINFRLLMEYIKRTNYTNIQYGC